MSAESEIVQKAMEAIRKASDPFIDMDLTEERKVQLLKAMEEAMEFFGPPGGGDMVMGCEPGEKAGEILVTIRIPPHMAVVLAGAGLLCTKCMSMKTEEVDPQDLKAYEALADYPGNYRRCCDCGEYLEVARG